MKNAIDLYKSEFRPSKNFNKPIVNVCLWALTARTEKEAKYLFASRAAWKIGRNYGHLGPITDPDNALNIIKENNWQEHYELMFQNSLVGEIGNTKEKIANLAKNNDIDEIAILTWCHSEKARIQSYELFADEFKLNAKKSLQKTC
jgi:alkanesulfonate monooxygenase SsuD/methylene tetrahydromethanopterin reductase-like flavin-dependent oxidoreductase (luciferase family)